VIEVIGSYAELAARLGRELPQDFDPHKPGIDELTWPAPGGGTMRRVPEVIDAWFDSGSMPFAQWHYPFEHQTSSSGISRRLHRRRRSIRPGAGSTRCSRFPRECSTGTLIATWWLNGHLLDAKGKKMSKSLGNIVEPWDLIQRHGADVARLYLLASSEVWGAKRYDANRHHRAGRRVPSDAEEHVQPSSSSTPAARFPSAMKRRRVRWIDGSAAAGGDRRRDGLAWEGYDPTNGVRPIIGFLDDLSNWYVRLSRPRFWAPTGPPTPRRCARSTTRC
jgi:isoleucyl-tRNA synthetase